MAQLGSQTYGNPVVANGKVYVGTNNGAGYLEALSGRRSTWAACCASTKRTASSSGSTPAKSCPPAACTTGRCRASAARRWSKATGCGSSPAAAKCVCLDTEGFHDGENDGPFKAETHTTKDEADVIWALDMMDELGVSQHNMCSCSVTAAGDMLFVSTSNGVDEAHINIPAPNAPSFIAMDKNTGKVLWTDNSPGTNILHGQWSSPRPTPCSAACRR